MDYQTVETAVIEEVVVEANEVCLRDLSELQLAYVGGGIGTTVL